MRQNRLVIMVVVFLIVLASVGVFAVQASGTSTFHGNEATDQYDWSLYCGNC